MPRRFFRISVKSVLRAIGYGLMALSLYFLYGSLKTSWEQVGSGLRWIDPLYLLAAFLLTGFMLFLMPLGWKAALQLLGFPLKFRLSASIYFRTSIFRYLPGSFWQFTARAYVAQRHGISLGLYTTSSFVELFFLLSLGGMFAGMGLAGYFDNRLFWFISLIPFLAGPIILFGGSRILPAGWKIVPPARLAEKGRSLLVLTGGYLLVWLVYGTSIYIILNAFPGACDIGLGKTISLNTLAWAIGFLSFSPGGLGVRELGLAMLLPPEYKALAMMAGLIHRIMEMVWEILLFAMSTILVRKN